MIAGIGVDIVEISRIRNALTRWKDAFLRRIFTENEINYSRGKNHPINTLPPGSRQKRRC